jgi:cbb3-type cytochrome c oxidase subunit II
MSIQKSALLLGALATVLLAIFMTVFLPAAQRYGRTAIAGDSGQPYNTLQAHGRDVYKGQGCLYCHTQQVRPVTADFGLGQISVAGDYAHDEPPLLGTERNGPDLAHVASRGAGRDTEAWHILHLQQPDTMAPNTIMPRYNYLSQDDLEALAAYLLTLK